jgi:diguanylate cyclase (GGDEF)-like protein
VAGPRTARRKKKSKTKSRRPAATRGRAATTPGACPLTALPHGAAAKATWEAALQAAQERAEPCTLALLDVDGFAQHVQALGRARSDALLKDVGARLRQALSDQALLGRLGGDQFGVALPGVVVEEALGLLESVRQAVASKPFRLGRGAKKRTVELTLSAGAAGLGRDADELSGLLESARGALWRAKERGGNRLGLPGKEKMVLKTSYYQRGQLERLKRLAASRGVSESVLLREALEDLLLVYKDRPPVDD